MVEAREEFHTERQASIYVQHSAFDAALPKTSELGSEKGALE
jgi:hypothetical protein